MQNVTESTSSDLRERYQSVRDRVDEAARRAGRVAGDVMIVAVSKYADLDQVRELIDLGHRDFGESRVQQLGQRASMVGEWLGRRKTMASAEKARREASETLEAQPADAARWHMVGRLQRNKVKKLLPDARLIHSVDSMRLAEEIQTRALQREQIVDVLLQVNAAGEAQKGGVTLPAAVHVAEQIDSMTYVRLRGVMTMAPIVENPDDAKFAFERARGVFEEIRDLGLEEGACNILSMGMTHDFEAAIECGANCVRIGSAIFGEPRQTDEDDD